MNLSNMYSTCTLPLHLFIHSSSRQRQLYTVIVFGLSGGAQMAELRPIVFHSIISRVFIKNWSTAGEYCKVTGELL